jgi:hypothetical protein
LALKTIGGRLFKFCFYLVAFSSVASCGYKFAGQSSRLPDHVKTLSVTIFQNNTKEPNLELAVTTAISEKFRHDGRLDLVAGGKADAALSGSIESYLLEPLAYDTLNRAAQYRVRMTVKIKFEDKATGGAVVEKTLDTQWDYVTGGAITSAERGRQDAINQASSYLGDKIIGLLLEGF